MASNIVRISVNFGWVADIIEYRADKFRCIVRISSAFKICSDVVRISSNIVGYSRRSLGCRPLSYRSDIVGYCCAIFGYCCISSNIVVRRRIILNAVCASCCSLLLPTAPRCSLLLPSSPRRSSPLPVASLLSPPLLAGSRCDPCIHSLFHALCSSLLLERRAAPNPG